MVLPIRHAARALLLLAIVPSCGGDDTGQDGESEATAADASGSSGGPSTSASTTSSGTSADAGSTDGPGSTSDATTSPADGTTTAPGGTTTGDDGTTTGVASDCDYETVDGMIVIEAENLPISEDWQIQTAEPGYSADGYIVWTGGSNNGDPTHGVMEVTIHVAEPGRYRLQWRNRIGMGTNTTEHNDTWVKFPDATDYYGLQSPGADELRRYPRPRCEDADAMAAIEALPQVAAATCVEGSSVDDWFKVYSSGASDWSWSTRTNDNNAFNVMVEFDAPGDYSFMMAARADWHLVDRIVIHEESLEDGTVQDLAAAETACRP